MKLKIKNDRFTKTSSAQAAVLLVIARHEAIKGSTPKSRGSKDKRVLIPEAAHRETVNLIGVGPVGHAVVAIQVAEPGVSRVVL